MLPRALRAVACNNVASSSRTLATTVCRRNQASDSLFDKSQSTWDHIMEGIKDKPIPRQAYRPPRPQTLSTREVAAFDDMFDSIFQAANEKDGKEGMQQVVQPGSDLVNLFGKIRRHTSRQLRDTEKAQALDLKKEGMERCNSDQELLEWAMKEVFGESESFREAALHAVQEAQAVLKVLPTGSKEPEFKLPDLQPPAYSQVIALLMKTFRERYRDPHLSMSIFDYARTLSTESYIFGCHTPSYNQLLESRWDCFRDLSSVKDVLLEMRANSIECDEGTRKIIENIRHEGMPQGIKEKGKANSLLLITQIESLAAIQRGTDSRYRSKRATIQAAKKKNKWSEEWKETSFAQKDDGWQFGDWAEEPLAARPWYGRKSEAEMQESKMEAEPPLMRYRSEGGDAEGRHIPEEGANALPPHLDSGSGQPPQKYLDDDDNMDYDEEEEGEWEDYELSKPTN